MVGLSMCWCYLYTIAHNIYPDSKIHGANMGPIWGRQDPGGPHAGPMNPAIWVHMLLCSDLLYPPLNKVEGRYTGFTLSVRLSVRLSVCGQNRVRSVSSTLLIGSISYLHILSSNFRRRRVTCKDFIKIKKNISFGKLFKFVSLTLSCFDLGILYELVNSMGNHGAAGGILRTRSF